MDSLSDTENRTTIQMGQSVAEPSVSVVIPAYNAASFIGRAVGSVEAQTLQDFEIIVVDDCSTDDTVDVVHQLAAIDPRITLLTSETNRGPSVARNRGFEAARGKWIAVLDADDAYRPERLATLIAAAEAQSLDMIGDDIVYYDSQADREVGAGGFGGRAGTSVALTLDRYLESSTFRPTFSEILFSEPRQISLLKFVISNRFVRATNLRYPVAYRYGEDFRLYFDALVAGGRAAILAEPLYIYTQQFGSVSQQRSPHSRTLPDRGAVVAGLDEILKQHPALTGRQKALIGIRREATLNLLGFERFRQLVRERKIGSAVALLWRTPGIWRFALREARRSAMSRASKLFRAVR